MSREFFRSRLALAVALALGTGASLPRSALAQAAEAEGGAIEEITVTGIRASLKKSMDIKRDNAGVVDAITAQDIGAFPDTNLAESLQRITGVSIDRSRGEGKYVTVRGFGPEFNLVLLNGRQMPTTGDEGVNRSFDFGNLASESVSAVEVYKSSKADLPTGGIGSTINIRTTRPLQNPGLHATVAGSGMHDTSTSEGDEWTPEISALFSNTFLDDTVGIALTAIRQDRNNGANTGSVGGWRTFTGNTDNCWCSANPSEWGGIPYNADQVNRPTSADDRYSVPQTTGYELAEWDRTRTNGQLTVQWKPVEAVTATVDYTYSEVELERTFSNYSAWYNFGGQQTEWNGESNASPIKYSEVNGGTGDYAMGAGADATKAENESVGFNLIWQVTDRLKMEFDAHDSSAERTPDSRFGSSSLLAIASFSRQQTTTYFDRGDLPVLSLDLSRPLSANDMIVTGSVFRNDYAKMDIQQQRVTGVFEFDEDRFLQSIDFGIELSEVDNRSAFSVVQRDAWGGVTQPGAIGDLLAAANSRGDFSEISGGDDAALQTEYFTYGMAGLIARTEQLMASGDATITQLGDMGDCGTGLCASSNFSTDRRTTEESNAGYAQLNMAAEIAEMPLNIRLGIRYEQTDVTSEALAPNYTGLNWVGGNEFSAVRGAGDFTQLEGDYDQWLPNLDFRLTVIDDLVIRAAFSKSITRANYADIQGGQTIDQLVRIDGGNGTRGNPNLQPLESKNMDFGFEYYYGADSVVSAGYFYKKVANFIGRTEFNEPLFALPHPGQGALYDEAVAAIGGNPTSGEVYSWILANRPNAPGVDVANGIISGVAGDPLANFRVIVPVNQDEAVVDGWEFNIQHNFGESGFGMIANATIVDSDSDYDDMSLNPQFVVSGVSDSANLVGYYERYGFSIRLAWNWRDDFLAGTGQANVGGIPPTYVEAYDQIDVSASYKWGDHLQFFVDAINVTDETTHVYGRTKEQTLFAAQSGPRYNLGMRYTF